MAQPDPIDQLGQSVRHMRIEFERFFNGALPVPPLALLESIQDEIRRLRNGNLKGVADNFRLGSIEAHFNSLHELISRRLRDLEEGRNAAAHAAPVARGQQLDVESGVVMGEVVDPEAAEALYRGLVSAGDNAPRFDLATFRTYLDRQLSSIREKTGCSEVQFRLAREGGHTKLKAKPIRAPS
jgi:hypothetical protein